MQKIPLTLAESGMVLARDVSRNDNANGPALSSSIFEIMEKNSVGLWEHSLGAGVAANVIARRLKLPDCEEISTAALLHDIGKVIIRLNFGDDYRQLLALIKCREFSMLEAERELLGTDHVEVGAWLAKSWHLPDKLIEPIARHHDVGASLSHRTKTAVVHFADILIKASGFGFGGDDFVFIVPLVQAEPVCKTIIGNFHIIAADLFEEREKSDGYYIGTNRKGQEEKIPLISVAIAVVPTDAPKLNHYGKVAEVAAELKALAKKSNESCYVVDRRRK